MPGYRIYEREGREGEKKKERKDTVEGRKDRADYDSPTPLL